MTRLQKAKFGYEEIPLLLRISAGIRFFREPCYALTSGSQIAFSKRSPQYGHFIVSPSPAIALMSSIR